MLAVVAGCDDDDDDDRAVGIECRVEAGIRAAEGIMVGGETGAVADANDTRAVGSGDDDDGDDDDGDNTDGASGDETATDNDEDARAVDAAVAVAAANSELVSDDLRLGLTELDCGSFGCCCC